MKYRVQTGKPTMTELDPEGWREQDAPDMEAAAVTHLQANPPPSVTEYPLMVYVTDGKHLHPNGAPEECHGYLFQLAIEEDGL